MNRAIRRKLMEIERPLRNIEQWYKRVMNLDRYQRECRQKEKRLQGRRETGAQAPRQNITVVIASSLVKKTRNLVVDASRACSNKESGENKHNYDEPKLTDMIKKETVIAVEDLKKLQEQKNSRMREKN